MTLDLPKVPIGFTRRMTMHMNWGGGKGAGLFEIRDPSGKKMPFGYQYDTQKNGLTGFTVPGDVNRVFTWAELRAYYKEDHDDHARAGR